MRLADQPDLGQLTAPTVGPLAGLLSPRQFKLAVGGGRGWYVEFDGHWGIWLLEPVVNGAAAGVEADEVAEAVSGIDHTELVTCLGVEPRVAHLQWGIVKSLGILAPGQRPARTRAEADQRRAAEIWVGSRVGIVDQVVLAAKVPQVVIEPARARIGALQDRLDGAAAVSLGLEGPDLGELVAEPE